VIVREDSWRHARLILCFLEAPRAEGDFWHEKYFRALVLIGLLISCAYILDAQSSPLDYPQWRGQDRDGSARAFVAPKAWPAKLMLIWQVQVGEGCATPLVVGNKVYSFTRRDSDEMMMALNADTGKIIWLTNYPAPYKMAEPTKAHGRGPKSTPWFLDGKLYAWHQRHRVSV
jgi:hypothetical protein